MNKLQGYFILILEVLFTSWEWLFLFTAAYFLISSARGGFISAILFFTISVLRIFLSRPIGRALANISSHDKFKIALLARLALLSLSVFLALFGLKPIFLIVPWMVFAGLFYVIDLYSSIELRYVVARNDHFSFARISSILNIGKRGIVAVSSVVPILIPSEDWKTLGSALLIAMVAGIISMIFVIFNQQKQDAGKLPDINVKDSAAPAGSGLKWEVSLLALYMFGFNLFFGSNALMLIKAIKQYSIEFHAISPLTVFYASFVIANIGTLLWPKMAEKHSNWRNIFLLFVLSGILCIFYWIFKSNLSFFFLSALIFGVIYAVQITFLYVKISANLRGKSQAYLMAKIDSWGRVGFVVTQIAVGLLLDSEIEPLLLSALFGMGAVVSAITVGVIAKNWPAVISNLGEMTTSHQNS